MRSAMRNERYNSRFPCAREVYFVNQKGHATLGCAALEGADVEIVVDPIVGVGGENHVGVVAVQAVNHLAVEIDQALGVVGVLPQVGMKNEVFSLRYGGGMEGGADPVMGIVP